MLRHDCQNRVAARVWPGSIAKRQPETRFVAACDTGTNGGTAGGALCVHGAGAGTALIVPIAERCDQRGDRLPSHEVKPDICRWVERRLGDSP